MTQIRDIKNRMIAVGTIRRITKTMQMIATAKFTAAAQRTKATRPYAETIRQLAADLAAAAGEIEHVLIDGPAEKPGRELLLAITSDRGLCGAYNANVFRTSITHIRMLREAGIELDVETSGKKAIGFFKFQKIEPVEKHFIGDAPAYADVEEIASRYITEFVSGCYDAVRIAYMRFESNARQVPELMQLLPMKLNEEQQTQAGGPSANYEFSPSGEKLLADLLPLAVKAQLFQAFNDAVVSEQIMRMVAMKAATENAKDLGKTLNRQYNRARQTQITTELSEIIGGAAALG